MPGDVVTGCQAYTDLQRIYEPTRVFFCLQFQPSQGEMLKAHTAADDLMRAAYAANVDLLNVHKAALMFATVSFANIFLYFSIGMPCSFHGTSTI